MILSMTGYAQQSKKIGSLIWTLEIHSLNRKTLDIQISLPKELLFLEMEMRKWVSSQISRGFLTLRLTVEGELVHQLFQSKAVFHQLKELKKNWMALAEDLGYEKEVVRFDFLVSDLKEQSSRLFFKALDKEVDVEKLLKELVGGAVQKILKMKEEEGKQLEKDLRQRFKSIEENVKSVEKRAKFAPEKMQNKLEKRIAELKTLEKADEERILREIVIFSERIDIAEELTRLKSHLLQASGGR